MPPHQHLLKFESNSFISKKVFLINAEFFQINSVWDSSLLCPNCFKKPKKKKKLTYFGQRSQHFFFFWNSDTFVIAILIPINQVLTTQIHVITFKYINVWKYLVLFGKSKNDRYVIRNYVVNSFQDCLWR